jgi:hypothetical protein
MSKSMSFPDAAKRKKYSDVINLIQFMLLFLDHRDHKEYKVLKVRLEQLG